ncbi:MAG: hypothetical protein ACRDE8_15415 [Ginsengibacter sp.]
MIFWNKFCGFVLIFLFISFFTYAQNTQPVKLNINSFFQKNKLKISDTLIRFTQPVVLNKLKNTSQSIPEDFYTKNMGFFCKRELVIEKFTKIPLRFRLGSLQQCNYYEGKKQ